MVRADMQREASMERSSEIAPAGTCLDAFAASLAAVAPIRGVVLQNGVRDHQPEDNERAQFRVYDQRIASRPAEPGLAGPGLFEDRGGIDEHPPPGAVPVADKLQQGVEPLTDCDMVIGRERVRGYPGGDFMLKMLRPAVRHGANHHAPGPIDQQRRVEALVEVAGHIAERAHHAAGCPPSQVSLPFGEFAAGCNAAEVEPQLRRHGVHRRISSRQITVRSHDIQ